MFTRLLIALALLAGAAQAKAQTSVLWPDEIMCPGTSVGTIELYLTASPAVTEDTFNGHYLYINPYWGVATNGLAFNADGSPYVTIGTKMPGCTGIAISKLVTRSFGSGSVTPPPLPITLNPTKVALAAADFTGGWVIVNNPIAQGLLLPAASATGQAPGAKLICFSVEGQGPLQLTAPTGSGWFTGVGTSPTQTALQTASFCLWSDGANYHIAGGAP
jgi:hypothetical protein